MPFETDSFSLSPFSDEKRTMMRNLHLSYVIDLWIDLVRQVVLSLQKLCVLLVCFHFPLAYIDYFLARFFFCLAPFGRDGTVGPLGTLEVFAFEFIFSLAAATAARLAP